MCCTRLPGNTGRKNDAKKSPYAHHRTTLSGYIFLIKACIGNRKKNLLNSNISSSTCPHNMANFGPLSAEIGSGVWGTPVHFNGFGFACWLCYCSRAAMSFTGGQPNCARCLAVSWAATLCIYTLCPRKKRPPF